MVAISRYINESFITRLANLGRGNTSKGAAIAASIKGGANEGKEARAVQAGIKLYTTALSGMNLVGSLVNIAHSDLKNLGKLTDSMIAVAEGALSPTISNQSRRGLETQLRSLGAKFETILKEAQSTGKDYLTVNQIEESLTSIGLNPKSFDSTEKVMDQFHVVSSKGRLAEPTIENIDMQLPKGLGLPQRSHTGSPPYSSTRGMPTRADAFMVYKDLIELRKQIDTNMEALDGVSTLVGENLRVVRAAAITFNELSDRVGSIEDAEQLSELLSINILKYAGSSSQYAHNLDSIAAAAVLLEKENLLAKK